MNFAFTREQEAFRQEILDFLKQELPPGWIGATYYEDELEEEELWAMGRKLAPKLGQRGWLAMAWPREYGGQERSHIEQTIFKEEMAYNRAPGVDMAGISMCGPTMLAFGTPEQKKRFLPPIAKGEVFWCQGFSEPEAGSDLASVRTKAVEQNGYFVLNGQKVWTSGGHRAAWMFLLARTDPDAPKHKGISFLLLDMKTPGVEVRPLVNIIGGHAFNEVFFDNARVPKANLVGQKNDGWTVATTLLNFERSGIDRVASARRLLDEVIEFVREGKKSGRLTQPVEVVRQKLAEMVIELEVGRWMGYHVSWMQQKGQMPWAEAPISKVFGSELMQRVANVGMQLLSLYGQLEKGSKWISLGGRVAHMYQSSLGRTLGGGTSEIQRNLIATRGLGLPRG